MTRTGAPRRGDTIRFRPAGKTNRISIVVERTWEQLGRQWVMGVRTNSAGCIDSQSRRHSWMVEDFETLEDRSGTVLEPHGRRHPL